MNVVWGLSWVYPGILGAHAPLCSLMFLGIRLGLFFDVVKIVLCDILPMESRNVNSVL